MSPDDTPRCPRCGGTTSVSFVAGMNMCLCGHRWTDAPQHEQPHRKKSYGSHPKKFGKNKKKPKKH